MKNSLLGLSLSLLTMTVFADTSPTLKDLRLGNFQGRDFISECSLRLSENQDGKIVATFSKGGLTYKSKSMNSELPLMVSSDKQVWFDFLIEGMTHVNLILDNEDDLRPISYTVLEGRSNKIFKCKNLK